MIQPKLLEKNEIDSTGKKVYLTDNTGLYSDTNLGGFGGLNLSREQVVLIPIGVLIDSKGKELPIKFQLYSEIVDKEWVALIPKDGWLQFSLVWAPLVANPQVENYEDGDVVFDTTEYNLKKKRDSVLWEVVQPIQLRNTEYEGKRLEQLHVANTSMVKNHLNKLKTDLQIDSESLSNKKKIQILQEKYDLVRGILTSAEYQFCIGNKFVAAKELEFLQTNNYEQLQ